MKISIDGKPLLSNADLCRPRTLGAPLAIDRIIKWLTPEQQHYALAWMADMDRSEFERALHYVTTRFPGPLTVAADETGGAQ
jgi:hypothetical protein